MVEILDRNTCILLDQLTNSISTESDLDDYINNRDKKLQTLQKNNDICILHDFFHDSIELEHLQERYRSRCTIYFEWSYTFRNKKVWYIIYEPINILLQSIFIDLYAILFDSSSGSEQGKHKKLALNLILSDNKDRRISGLSEKYCFISVMEELLKGHPQYNELMHIAKAMKESWDDFITGKREQVDLARHHFSHPPTSVESKQDIQKKFSDIFVFEEDDHRKMMSFFGDFIRLRNCYLKPWSNQPILNLGRLNEYLNEEHGK